MWVLWIKTTITNIKLHDCLNLKNLRCVLEKCLGYKEMEYDAYALVHSERNSSFHICRELDLLGRETLLDVAFGGQKCLKQEGSTGRHQVCTSVFLMR